MFITGVEQCRLLWCCCIKSVWMISSTELLADHPGLVPGWGCYPGIMRYKHSLHHQQLHCTTLHCGARIPSGPAWPDNFESEAADHYKSNRPALLLIGNQNGMQYLTLLISGAGGGAWAGGAGGEQGLDEVEEVQWLPVSYISGGSLSVGAADWLEPDYPVIEFVMRTPAQLYSPSWPWSNDTLSPDCEPAKPTAFYPSPEIACV